MAMFNTVRVPPTVGCLLRSYMGTSIGRVVSVTAVSGGFTVGGAVHSWVTYHCVTVPLGNMVKGAWVPFTGKRRTTRLVTQYIQPSPGWRNCLVVVPGSNCPL